LLTERAACTIISINYLHFARTLFESFHALHPQDNFYVLIVDRSKTTLDLSREGFHIVWVEDLGIPDFLSTAFKYDIMELNTNVKPTFLSYLLGTGIERLIYLDPDIYVFASVDFIFDLLSSYSIILTPHSLSPTPPSERFLEQQFLSLGIYNLGFIALAKSDESSRFLLWWEERCLAAAFAEARTGLYVDQKWITVAPCFFEHILILRHYGCNVAYWNLFERKVSQSAHRYIINDNDPLVFYHFSGYRLEQPSLVSEKLRIPLTLNDRSDLKLVYSIYHDMLSRNMDAVAGGSGYSYSYGAFSNGAPVSTLARRIYASMLDNNTAAPAEDPFDETGSFYEFARKHRLVDCRQREAARNNYNPHDKRVWCLTVALRLALRLLGVETYTLLLRYLSFISVLRNQILVLQDNIKGQH
jgi:hypothetical protein